MKRRGSFSSSQYIIRLRRRAFLENSPSARYLVARRGSSVVRHCEARPQRPRRAPSDLSEI